MQLEVTLPVLEVTLPVLVVTLPVCLEQLEVTFLVGSLVLHLELKYMEYLSLVEFTLDLASLVVLHPGCAQLVEPVRTVLDYPKSMLVQGKLELESLKRD
ncbi:hypothetical protein PR002_g1906 [Phytophthora rubi]|uniref:Uncharacterized protein n=1 Tax=Phytophthora rubi TaxID=129364 RepID=A0A6A3NXL8_9STRA|nr:hypothetical protein PR002_g1906 [Phytophthora rubi]